MFKKRLRTEKNILINEADSNNHTYPGIILTIDNNGAIIGQEGKLADSFTHKKRSLSDIIEIPQGIVLPKDLTGKTVEITLLDDKGEDRVFHGVIEDNRINWKLKLIHIKNLNQTETNKKESHKLNKIDESIESVFSADLINLDEAIHNCISKLVQSNQLPYLSITTLENKKHKKTYSQACSIVLSRHISENHDNSSSEDEKIEHLTLAGKNYRLIQTPYFSAYKKTAHITISINSDVNIETEILKTKCKLLASAILSRENEKKHIKQVEVNKKITSEQDTHWIEYDIQQHTFHLSESIRKVILTDSVCAHSAFAAAVHEADRDEFDDRLKALSRNHANLNHIFRLKKSDGTLSWYELRLTESELNKDIFHGSISNIDTLVKLKNEAGTADERLRNMIANAPAIIYLQKYKDGALSSHFFSDSIEHLLGWCQEEFKKNSLASYIHDEDKEIFYNRTATLLKHGIVSSHYRIIDSEGTYHWMLDEVKLIRDQWGQPQEAVGIYIDITESVQANDKLNASEERYRVLVEDSPAIICRYNKDLTINFANKLLLDYLETDNKKSINLNNFLSDEQKQSFNLRLEKLSAENPISNAEICLHIPGRKPLWVVWAERGFFDESGNLTEIQAVGRDNTEVHLARLDMYQSAKMSMLGELATTLAHEVNQPLCVIKMSTANVRRKIKSGHMDFDYIDKKLERIDEQIERSNRTIEHLRFFGRRSALDNKLFSPQSAIDGALSLTKDSLQNAHISISLKTFPTPQVLGHQDQLEQVLINLIINAKDALLEKSANQENFTPEIKITLNHNEDTIIISVEDNGPGIPEEYIDSIFDSFFTTKPHGKGTGIGLNISFGIIEKMQGTITARNTTKGTTFNITLPTENKKLQCLRDKDHNDKNQQGYF